MDLRSVPLRRSVAIWSQTAYTAVARDRQSPRIPEEKRGEEANQET